MPFTFFAHQAPVLPFKARWPRLASGTGLVLGSMSPDFGYFVLGSHTTREWHRVQGVLLYCLPLSLLLYLLITRLIAAPVARHLPSLGDFRLRHWAYLEAQPRTARQLALVAVSVLLGAATHLAWDLFTHGGSWMGDYVPWLAEPVLHVGHRAIVGSSVLWVFSTVAGGLFTLLVLREVGGRGLLAQWAELRAPGSTRRIDPDAEAATSHLAFWGVTLAFTALGGAFAYLSRPPGFYWHDKATWVLVFLRTVSVGMVGLCISAWRERRAWRHRSGTAQGPGREVVDSAA